jgi:flotillin
MPRTTAAGSSAAPAPSGATAPGTAVVEDGPDKPILQELSLVASPSASSLVGGLVVGALACGIALLYKKCPPNRLLVIYGMGKPKAEIIHGGGQFVVPVVQSSEYLSLEPMAMHVKLTGALSMEKIRCTVPAVFTVAVASTEPVRTNAAERLLGQGKEGVQQQSEEIVIGQLRQVLATLTIEEINQDREKFVSSVTEHCHVELNKLGIVLLNSNIQDIVDESGVIEALGQKAAAEAKQQALIDVSVQERHGAVGVADNSTRQQISLATRQRAQDIGVREAERDAQVRLQQLVAEEATEVNLARAVVANSEATLAVEQAEARQRAEVKVRETEAGILLAEANAKAITAEAYSRQVEAEQRAELEALAKAEKAKVVIDAEAQAESTRIIAQGKADATLILAKATAQGEYEILARKGEGLGKIVANTGSSQEAFQLLMLDHLDKLAETSATAISNIKFDKVVVWDGGGAGGPGGSAVPDFVRGMASSLPPTMDVLKEIAGLDFTKHLGSREEGPVPEPVATATDTETRTETRQ